MSPNEPVTVLHVDDDPALLRLVEEIFADEAPNLDYLPAEAAGEALEALADVRPPALLLLDRRLPGTDLWSFVEEAADELEIVAVPFFVLSGSEDPEAIAEAYANGACGYLAKPPDADGFYELARFLDRFTRLAALPGRRG